MTLASCLGLELGKRQTFGVRLLMVQKFRRSPVEVGSLSQYLQGFSTIPGGFLAGFLNHQQDLSLEAVELWIPNYSTCKRGTGVLTWPTVDVCLHPIKTNQMQENKLKMKDQYSSCLRKLDAFFSERGFVSFGFIWYDLLMWTFVWNLRSVYQYFAQIP